MKNKKTQIQSQNRIFYLDVLRVVACLAVIMIHVSGDHVVNSKVGSVNFWIGNLFDAISRIGVPIFVMISGALILDKNYDFTQKKLLRHIVKMIDFYIFWSIFYCVLNRVLWPLMKKQSIDFSLAISSFISDSFHLWYCFMIIGLYLLVPLLRLWVKKTNKKNIEYFLVLSFLFIFLLPQIIKIFSYYSINLTFINHINNNAYLSYIGGYVPYFILGWYLHNFDLKYKKLFYCLGILSLLYTVIMTFVFSYTTNTLIMEYDNLSINIMLQTSAIFVAVKSLYKNHLTDTNRKFDKTVMFISKNSLGIYALHLEIINICYFINSKLSFNNAIVDIIGVFAITLIVSLLISYLISKIQLLKKIV